MFFLRVSKTKSKRYLLLDLESKTTSEVHYLEADQPAQSTLDGDGGPPPQLRRQGVPQHLRRRVIARGAERLP